VSNIAGSSVLIEQSTPAASIAGKGASPATHTSGCAGSKPGTRRTRSRAPRAREETLVFDRAHSVTDAICLQQLDRIADRTRSGRLTRVRNRSEPGVLRDPERGLERLRGKLGLPPAEPDGDNTTVAVLDRVANGLHGASTPKPRGMSGVRSHSTPCLRRRGARRRTRSNAPHTRHPRGFGVDAAMETVRYSIKYRDRGVVAVGLGGREAEFPPQPFEPRSGSRRTPGSDRFARG